MRSNVTTIKNILVVFSIIIYAWCTVSLINLIIIFPWEPKQLIYAEQPEHADAIVVLEGEMYYRIDYALTLLDQGYSDLFIFPGLQLKANENRINRWKAKNPQKAEFIISSGPTSTFEEAIAAKRIIEQRKIKTILLVTSSYHSYRASWIFKKVLPRVKVISVPVPLGKEWFVLEHAKSDTFHKNVVKSEQTKFFWYYFGYGWRWY